MTDEEMIEEFRCVIDDLTEQVDELQAENAELRATLSKMETVEKELRELIEKDGKVGFKIGEATLLLFGYSTDKDLKRAVKDIERVLTCLADNSLYGVEKALQPYRLKAAKQEKWEDKQ